MAPPLTALGLFAGIGGLELGVRAACGARFLGLVERDAYAAAVLLERMDSQDLESAPVWCGDVSHVDWAPFVDRVDLVCAGFPCQDVSVAGLRAGLEAGERTGLWREVVRCVRQVRPYLVFVENVPGLIGLGLDRVLADLAALGFDADWGCIRASTVGAPHRRDRLFLLARRNDVGSERVSDALRDALRNESERGDGPAQPAVSRNAEPRDVGAGMADSDGARRPEARSGRQINAGGEPLAGRGDVADAYVLSRLRGEHEPQRIAEGRASTSRCRGALEHRWPPEPDDADGWRRWIADGGPAPAVENAARISGGERSRRKRVLEACENADSRDARAAKPGFRRGADGVPGRVDRLRCLGNAVVPQQAELAFRLLAERAGLITRPSANPQSCCAEPESPSNEPAPRSSDPRRESP